MGKDDGLEDRVRRVELRLAYLTGAGLVALAAVLAFMGVTSWKTIPEAAESAVNAEIEPTTRNKIEEAVTRADKILSAVEFQKDFAQLRVEVEDHLGQAPKFEGFGTAERSLTLLRGTTGVGPHGSMPPRANGQRVCFRPDCGPAFTATPTVLATATFAYTTGGTKDVFAVQAKDVTTSSFVVDWIRLDASSSSGGGLSINWLATGPGAGG